MKKFSEWLEDRELNEDEIGKGFNFVVKDNGFWRGTEIVPDTKSITTSSQLYPTLKRIADEALRTHYNYHGGYVVGRINIDTTNWPNSIITMYDPNGQESAKYSNKNGSIAFINIMPKKQPKQIAGTDTTWAADAAAMKQHTRRQEPHFKDRDLNRIARDPLNQVWRNH